MGAATLTPSATASASAVSIASAVPPSAPADQPPQPPLAAHDYHPGQGLTGVPAPLPSTSSFSPGSLVAGLFLAALAAAAFVMARRKRRAPRLVEILESASLGPKRAIVVARLGDEILVLGSSEGGVALLSTRPAAAFCGADPSPRSRLAAPRPDRGGWRADALERPAVQEEQLRGAFAAQPPPPAEEAAAARPPVQGAKGRVLDLLSRLKPRARPAAPAFEAALAESLEDLELRRKLAAGLSGQAGGPQSGALR